MDGGDVTGTFSGLLKGAGAPPGPDQTITSGTFSIHDIVTP